MGTETTTCSDFPNGRTATEGQIFWIRKKKETQKCKTLGIKVRDPSSKSNNQSKVIRNKNIITDSMSSTSSTVHNRETVLMMDVKVSKDSWMG